MPASQKAMLHCVLLGFLLSCVGYFVPEHNCEASEFTLQGDVKIGGIFPVHSAGDLVIQSSPVALECLTQPFLMQGYELFQVMRFAVEEINNSSTLLPNVSLGYEIFDFCTDAQNFPSILNLVSHNGRIKVRGNQKDNRHNVVGVVGPFGSSESLTIAPLFMMNLIPLISYGSSSYTLSNKLIYPSFLRTVPTNKDEIQFIVQIIQQFQWNWVAFIASQDEYSQDGLDLFRKTIQDTSICLASVHELNTKSNFEDILHKIDSLGINVIVVFSLEDDARSLLKTAIRINLRPKVWIAGDAWSMDPILSEDPEIKKVGTILGITMNNMGLPGFEDFVYRSRFKDEADECENCMNDTDEQICNQACENCTSIKTEEIVNNNPTFSFSVYSAVYTLAYALHNALNCTNTSCSQVEDVPPYLVLQHIRKSNFTLQNRQIKYDANGDPPASYAVVLWRPETDPFFLTVGTYDTYPTVQFTLIKNLVTWYENRSVPFSNCSVECEAGFARVQNSVHKCCFHCNKCTVNTYINTSGNLYTCASCKVDEWSEEGSTSCIKRTIVYLYHSEPLSVVFLVCAASFIVLSITITVLFAINYNTPVVKSAGGNMCFLMLVCLILSNIGVFFYFGVPQPADCVLRNIFFIFFYTVCLSCMAVRSFQIVSVFKMAAKFPKIHSWWVKYNGQWLCLAVYSVLHLIACWTWLQFGMPKPYNDTASFKDQTILSCDIGTVVTSILAWLFLWFLSVVCFCFSYMGKDLPKNYNEAKSITFSLVLFYLGWIAYFTAYIVSRGQYVQLLNAVAQLSSSYGIIFSFFIPRTYIIVFQPNKNTQAYFQTKIQTYTQTISRM
ncbi:taste receptor type 1 member 1-like [Astyanax mexicanus]|uniref:taste receptor type 1 member 1-like n=1 Tax=Astyanax mexicanus TaxID=7994 RepID=UPI0020CAFFD0|nr:taste receptor type 1 member 1-like [Astyanax mexicanus]